MATVINEDLIEYLKSEFNNFGGAFNWYQEWMNTWHCNIPEHREWSGEARFTYSGMLYHIDIVLKDMDNQSKGHIDHVCPQNHEIWMSSLISNDNTDLIQGYKEAISAKDELIAVLKENIAIMGAQLSIKWNQDGPSKMMNEHG